MIAAGVFLCVVFGAAFIMSRSKDSAKNTATAMSLKGSDSIWIAPNQDSAVAKNETPSVSEKSDAEPAVESNGPGSDVNGSTESSLTKGLEYPAEGETTAVVPSMIQTDNLSVVANGTTNIYQTGDSMGGQSYSSDGTFTTTFDFSSGVTTASAVTAENKAAEKAMRNADTRRGELAKSLDESNTRYVAPKKTLDASSITKTSSVTSKTVETKPATTVATAKPEVKPAESTRIPDRYWVQAASYSSKKKADEARAILDEYKVQCEVFTFEMDGTLYYRVRVGPYTTQTEASYWKKQVDSMEQFADAGTYIVNSSAPIAKN